MLGRFPATRTRPRMELAQIEPAPYPVEKGKGEKRDDKLHCDESLRPHSGELPWHQADPLEHRGTALASGCAAGRRPPEEET